MGYSGGLESGPILILNGRKENGLQGSPNILNSDKLIAILSKTICNKNVQILNDPVFKWLGP